MVDWILHNFYLYLSFFLLAIIIFLIFRYYQRKGTKYLNKVTLLSTIGLFLSTFFVWANFYYFLNGLKEYLLIHNERIKYVNILRNLEPYFYKLQLEIIPAFIFLIFIIFALIKTKQKFKD